MKTIVWDVDDVLNDLTRSWFEDWTSSKPCSLSYEELTSNPPHELLGITHTEYLTSLDDFRLSGKAAKMEPVPEIFKWFCRYGDSLHNVALTATPLCAGPVSAEWVMRNFGWWIRSFSIIPSLRSGMEGSRHHGTKSEFLSPTLATVKRDVLVDDNEQNVRDAISIGMGAVLIPRPWNRATLTMTDALAALTELALGNTSNPSKRVSRK